MSLLPVAEALARILSGVTVLASERVPVSDVCGRVLAEDITAPRDQPPLAMSAMDGYAVRAADLVSMPVTLTQTGVAPAGQVFDGTLGCGETVRVFTGAPLPEGADCVIMQEQARSDGTQITFSKPADAGQFVRPVGTDFRAGETVLHKGRQLSVRDVALAAALNQPMLAVSVKPKVAILATGDELLQPGSEPLPHQVISSNNFGIAAFVTHHGGIPIDLGIARDTKASLADALAQAAGADILVTLGGASVGDHDLVRPVLESCGMRLDFWKIAMRPGKPLMFGKLGAMRVLGLPGNPVSTLICAEVFLKPLLRALLGNNPLTDETERARLGAELLANGKRQAYLRATLKTSEDGLAVVTPFAGQDSAQLANLARADCLILQPAGGPALPVGAIVEILRISF